MKHAICVLAHKNAEQLNLFIEQFEKWENYFDIYLHIDRKSDIQQKIIKRNFLHFVEHPVEISWGRIEMIDATLLLLQKTLKEKYDYIHLISGSDVLVKPIDYFLDFFDKEEKWNYISIFKLPVSQGWRCGGQDRYKVFYPKWLIDRPVKKIKRAFRVIYREFILKTKIFQRRKFPTDCFYGGAQWFSISGDLAEWCLEYLEKHKEYYDFFRHTLIPDEMFFQTLGMLSPYKKKILNDNYRYTEWTGSKSGGPKELLKEDIDKAIQSKYLFARKVDNVEIAKYAMGKMNEYGHE